MHAFPNSAVPRDRRGTGRPKLDHMESSASAYSMVNGGSSGLPNGHSRTRSEAQQIQDADAFELQGLISDEENEAGHSPANKTHEDEENLLSPKE